MIARLDLTAFKKLLNLSGIKTGAIAIFAAKAKPHGKNKIDDKQKRFGKNRWRL